MYNAINVDLTTILHKFGSTGMLGSREYSRIALRYMDADIYLSIIRGKCCSSEFGFRKGPGARFTNDFLPTIQIRWIPQGMPICWMIKPCYINCTTMLSRILLYTYLLGKQKLYQNGPHVHWKRIKKFVAEYQQTLIIELWSPVTLSADVDKAINFWK